MFCVPVVAIMFLFLRLQLCCFVLEVAVMFCAPVIAVMFRVPEVAVILSCSCGFSDVLCSCDCSDATDWGSTMSSRVNGKLDAIHVIEART